MVRSLAITTLLLCVAVLGLQAQPAFQRTYAMGSQNEGRGAVIAANHDLYFAGTTNDNNLSQSNVYLVCTDSAGNFRWQRSYGGGGVEQGTGITLLYDQSLMIGGYSNSYNFTSDYDGYILRVEADGDTLWTLHPGTSAWDFITSQAKGLGDTVVFAGYSYGSGVSTALPWILKVLPDGMVAENRILSMPAECFVQRIRVLSDGKLLLGGFYGNGPDDPTDAWLGLCDASLDTLWNRRIDYGHAERISGVDVFPNGDLVFVGRMTLSTNGYEQNMVGRMDGAGVIAWDDIAGGDSTYDGFDEVFIRNDTVFCGGTTATFGQGARDFQLVTFDGAGQFIVGKTYGGSEGDQVRSCIPGDFGGVILSGYSNSFPVNQQTLFVVRTDSLLESTNSTVIGLPETPSLSLDVFPNPVPRQEKLRLHSKQALKTIRLLDPSGRELLQATVQGHSYFLEMGGFSAGLYYLLCEGDDSAYTLRKIVVTDAH